MVLRNVEERGANIMGYISVIDEKRLQIGMSIRTLATRASMDDDILGKTLHRKRIMKASELLILSKTLGLTLDDFQTDDKAV